jgi:Rad52/22 family double-strand break repair protein
MKEVNVKHTQSESLDQLGRCEAMNTITIRGQDVDWRTVGAALAAPFDPECVEWRPAGGKTAPGARVQLAAYVDARTVMERLDAVCGAGGWSFALEPIVMDASDLRVARGAPHDRRREP